MLMEMPIVAHYVDSFSTKLACNMNGKTKVHFQMTDCYTLFWQDRKILMYSYRENVNLMKVQILSMGPS